MAAANTDNFIKTRRNFSTQIGSGGVANSSTTTIPLASTTNLPTDTAVILTINRVDANGVVTSNSETIVGVVSGTNIVNAVRGAEGTAQAWGAGIVVEYLWHETNANRFVSGILQALEQSGRIRTESYYGADAGSANTYAVTLSPAPLAYASGMVIRFKAAHDNTSVSTLNVNGLGAKTIKKNGSTDLAAGDIVTGNVYTLIYDGTNFSLRPSTIQSLQVNGPEGFLVNGKIVASVATNNLTVAIKTLAGNDPSATDSVYVRIGDTIRTITAALSVTKNAGTNWFNAGSAEIAINEVDYFVYLGFNTTDGVVMGFSRFPGAYEYDDFSATTTNEKYCAISTITHAASTDYYQVIGRFAATLSAGAGFTWTVPTFTAKNLINYPIYETRWLTWTPTITGSGAMTVSSITNTTAKYRILRNTIQINYLGTLTTGGSASTSVFFTMPFTHANTSNYNLIGSAYIAEGTASTGVAGWNASSQTQIGLQKYNFSNWNLTIVSPLGFQGFYEI